MANLIIKPTSGGSLILQDEGGDAAVTVGTTGSTTLAGTANALGTVATMTLPVPSATAVYPANTIIQYIEAATSSGAVDATTAAVEIFSDASITPRVTGSLIIAIINIGGLSRVNTANDSTIDLRVTDGGGTLRKLLTNHYAYQSGAHGTGEPERAPLSWTVNLGTGTTAGTAFPVNVTIDNGNTADLVRCNADSQTSRLILMEVKS